MPAAALILLRGGCASAFLRVGGGGAMSEGMVAKKKVYQITSKGMSNALPNKRFSSSLIYASILLASPDVLALKLVDFGDHTTIQIDVLEPAHGASLVIPTGSTGVDVPISFGLRVDGNSAAFGQRHESSRVCMRIEHGDTEQQAGCTALSSLGTGLRLNNVGAGEYTFHAVSATSHIDCERIAALLTCVFRSGWKIHQASEWVSQPIAFLPFVLSPARPCFHRRHRV
jgi:hypothetical protein